MYDFLIATITIPHKYDVILNTSLFSYSSGSQMFEWVLLG